MSRLLFISDIHGNMEAVEALQKELPNIAPDKIYFLGDAVGKGPESHLALDWVRKNCDVVIRGNWDDGMILNQFPNDQYYCNQLGEERLKYISTLPFEAEVLISGLWFRLVHGRPTDRLYLSYDSMEDLEKGFISKVSSRVYNAYICADSHMPYIRNCSKGYAINTGSIGNSLGVPRVHGILIEGELDSPVQSPISFNVLSIPYDNEKAVKKCDLYPDMPWPEAYKKEILTGRYGRA